MRFIAQSLPIRYVLHSVTKLIENLSGSVHKHSFYMHSDADSEL